MKQNLFYISVCFLLSLNSFHSCSLSKESFYANWSYPSTLPRDSNLFGTWYSIDPLYTNLISHKTIYHSDGRMDWYFYDTLNKVFEIKNYGNKTGNRQTHFWSASNGLFTSYDIVLFSGDDQKKPHTSTTKYYVSPTKDSLFFFTNVWKLNALRKMPD